MLLFRRILRCLFAFNPSKRIFNALLPRSARRKIASGLDLDTGPFNRPIEDIEVVPIQHDSYLAVYYKRYGSEIGPGVSLYVHENEILRFDCFIGGKGHYHSLPCLAAWPGKDRRDLYGVSIDSQIDESARELNNNYTEHLSRHFRRSVRAFRFDPDKLESAVDFAKAQMRKAHDAECVIRQRRADAASAAQPDRKIRQSHSLASP